MKKYVYTALVILMILLWHLGSCGVLDRSPAEPEYETYSHGRFWYIPGESGEDGLFFDVNGDTLSEIEFQDSLRTFLSD